MREVAKGQKRMPPRVGILKTSPLDQPFRLSVVPGPREAIRQVLAEHPIEHAKREVVPTRLWQLPPLLFQLAGKIGRTHDSLPNVPPLSSYRIQKAPAVRRAGGRQGAAIRFNGLLVGGRRAVG